MHLVALIIFICMKFPIASVSRGGLAGTRMARGGQDSFFPYPVTRVWSRFRMVGASTHPEELLKP
jgi:hypothetical protein